MRIMFPRTPLALAFTLAALGAPLGAGEPPKSPSAAPREGLEALEAQLGRAVDRVSLPHAARLLGRVEGARGYRLPGYGLVFVLTPRTLPGGEGQVHVLHGPPHRQVRVETRHTGAAGAAEEDVETFERQVLVLQEETEASRRAAEEDMDRLVQDVRVRVAPPEPPEAPAPPRPPAPPAPAEAPLPPAPPPWKFWFETGVPEEKRDPAAVVADVRAALVDALASTNARLAGLGADERITVTVDFIPGGIFAAAARPEKTLVVSARVGDVEARARGALTPEELRKRVEVTEY